MARKPRMNPEAPDGPENPETPETPEPPEAPAARNIRPWENKKTHRNGKQKQ